MPSVADAGQGVAYPWTLEVEGAEAGHREYSVGEGGSRMERVSLAVGVFILLYEGMSDLPPPPPPAFFLCACCDMLGVGGYLVLWKSFHVFLLEYMLGCVCVWLEFSIQALDCVRVGNGKGNVLWTVVRNL